MKYLKTLENWGISKEKTKEIKKWMNDNFDTIFLGKFEESLSKRDEFIDYFEGKKFNLFEEFKKIGSFEIAKNRPEDYNQVSQEWISIINEIIDFWNKYYINQPTNFKKPIKVKDYVFTDMEADDFGDLYINRRR